MAQPITCDVCNSSTPAAFLMTRLDDGNTLGICLGCAGGFFGMLSGQLSEPPQSESAEADELAEQLSAESETETVVSGRAERFPYTEHVIPPGMRRRRGQRETVAEFQAGEPEASEPGPTDEA